MPIGERDTRDYIAMPPTHDALAATSDAWGFGQNRFALGPVAGSHHVADAVHRPRPRLPLLPSAATNARLGTKSLTFIPSPPTQQLKKIEVVLESNKTLTIKFPPVRTRFEPAPCLALA